MGNSNIMLKDLHIFRGTYKECMAQATEDMKFYLAWDTQQIFVGNKHGVKTPYCGVSSLKNQINLILDDFKQSIYESTKAYAESQFDQLIDPRIENLDARLNEGIANALKLAEEEKEKLELLKVDVSENTKYIEKVEGELVTVRELLGSTSDSTLSDLKALTESLDKLREELDNSYVSNEELVTILENYYASTEIDEKLSETLEASKEYTNEREREIRSEISGVESRIPTKISQLDNDSNFATQQYVSDEIAKADISDKLSGYALKSDIIDVAANPEVPSGTTTYDLSYIKIGEKYYKLPEKSTGPVVKQPVTSVISVTSSSNREFKTGTTNTVTFTIRADSLDAIETCSYDGVNIKDSLLAGYTKSVTISSPYTTSGRLAYTVKADTDTIDYSVSASSVSFSFYTPWYIGTEGNMTDFKYLAANNGQAFTISANNEYVYIYAAKEIEDPEAQVLAYGFAFPIVQQPSKQINGVNYYVYRSAETINDNAIKLTIY